MTNNEFEKQDAFTAEMIAAFDMGHLPPKFKPYFDWKRGVSDLPSKAEGYEMMDFAQEQLEEIRNIMPAPECANDHAKIISYLSAIDDELSTIIPILR